MIEHFQDRGEIGAFIEEEMQGIQRSGVGGSGDFDASIGAGQACGLQEFAN
jgi:hypothetical protein